MLGTTTYFLRFHAAGEDFATLIIPGRGRTYPLKSFLHRRYHWIVESRRVLVTPGQCRQSIFVKRRNKHAPPGPKHTKEGTPPAGLLFTTLIALGTIFLHTCRHVLTCRKSSGEVIASSDVKTRLRPPCVPEGTYREKSEHACCVESSWLCIDYVVSPKGTKYTHGKKVRFYSRSQLP